MRILQVIQKKQLRGAEVFACQLSTHLMAQGHTVRVVSLQEGDANLPFPEEIPSLSAQLKKRFSDWKGWKRLAKEIAAFQPDIVQANAGDTLKYAVLSKIFFKWNSPIVFRNASMVSAYIRSGLIRRFNAFLLSRVASVISVSEASRLDLIQTFSFDKNKTTVIPGGIEERVFSILDREPGVEYLVHVGGFSFEKNHRGLLRVFKEIRRQRPSAKLWLVGDGPLRKETEHYATTLGIEDSVQFFGFRNNPLDYIASANALLLPSIIEGLPGVVLEAFHTGTPVVAYRVGGVGELVNADTGWLVDKDDERAFINAVIHVLNEPAHAKVVAERAQALVRARFMNAGLARQFAGVYADILTKHE